MPSRWAASLIQHPAALTHRPVAPEARPDADILRLSIGLEHVDDLFDDLSRLWRSPATGSRRRPRCTDAPKAIGDTHSWARAAIAALRRPGDLTRTDVNADQVRPVAGENVIAHRGCRGEEPEVAGGHVSARVGTTHAAGQRSDHAHAADGISRPSTEAPGVRR
jgi:hypothetical protein